MFASKRLLTRNYSSLSTYGVQHIGKGIGRLTPLVITHGKGPWVWDDNGDKYLDMTSGIGVLGLGHAPDSVVQAVQKQAALCSHVQANIAMHKPMIQLIQNMSKIMPDPSLNSFIFVTTGAEGVENAVKLARHATKKQNIVTLQGGYHGRTLLTMTMTTSKTVYSAGFGPLPGQIFKTPLAHREECNRKQCELPKCSKCGEWALDEFKLLLKQQSAPSDTAAIVVEPVLGEGGYIPLPTSFMKGLRRICDKEGILLVADEVQTGMGRTGKYWAVEHYGVRPDILIFAKGIASGYPLAGIASRKELTDLQPPGSMGGTYAGNAVACSAANATLETFEKEDILKNVNERSQQIFALLKQELGDLKVNIRGLGLMIGIEFFNVEYGFANKVAKEAVNNGLLILNTGIHETLRLIPPLNVTPSEAKEAVNRLVQTIKTVRGK